MWTGGEGSGEFWELDRAARLMKALGSAARVIRTDRYLRVGRVRRLGGRLGGSGARIGRAGRRTRSRRRVLVCKIPPDVKPANTTGRIVRLCLKVVAGTAGWKAGRTEALLDRRGCRRGSLWLRRAVGGRRRLVVATPGHLGDRGGAVAVSIVTVPSDGGVSLGSSGIGCRVGCRVVGGGV